MMAQQQKPSSSNPMSTVAQQAAKYQDIGLMLQGGGALGAYQVGVYKALAQAQCLPSWVCGVSIGAINGAIIVGNEPSKRVARLEAFWALIATQPVWPFLETSEAMRAWSHAVSSWMTLTTGQPGFFKPRTANPWWWPAGTAQATSFYDSSELHATLKRLIDFGRLNSGEVRLSMGAVEVATGNNRFFDTHHERLEVEHIMASGALPPALPMIEIEGKHYWDGGIVSNTPLQYFLDQDEDKSALVFQVDLFSAKGAVPQQMSQVMTRQKDITYSSRTRQATTGFKRLLRLRQQLAQALQRVPAQQLRPGEAQLMHDYLDAGVINLIELIYQSKPFEGESKDYEFSSSSMQSHMQAGHTDTLNTLANTDWFNMPTAEQGVVEHDVHR
jgi:NTE family protein